MARIIDHPVLGKLDDRKKIPFTFDGKEYEAYETETIAAALLANGVRTLRVHEESGTPRGFYCNIGHCMECRVHVNGQANIRACLTVVKEKMAVERGKHHPNLVKRMVENQ
ncbi:MULTISPECIES: (2Fe-2S)-binding protein [Bacillales]|uniref:(2Fe-2S)-binding protein n=1 Tax=Bacillales TaxID=1385 RepID=UPI00096C359A|nr:(2Fe-2S)-binding protein [Paenibacillus sp. FSL R5-0490]OMF59886.1 (2Fe-2S)-binding protein [Paenibacillus sp. FSL R5-0490]